jgi:hypothetical protein
MDDFGFLVSICDPAIFFKRNKHRLVIIAAAVDDLTITRHPDMAIFEMKWRLNGYFKMKDLGELHWLLNMEIKRNQEKCTISFAQHSYIDLFIKCFIHNKHQAW